MSIETKLLMNETVQLQMKVITDELYEMMWNLQATPEKIKVLKEKLGSMVDEAWEDFRENCLNHDSQD